MAGQSQSTQRFSTRQRVPKQFTDYVDCSFSESEPSRFVSIPTRPDVHRRSRAGRGIRSRGGRNSTTKRSSDGVPISEDHSHVERHGMYSNCNFFLI